MFWFVKVYVDGGEHYNCAVSASSEYYAEKKARAHYHEEGEFVVDVEAEMFDTFTHGDPEDYEII